MQLTKTIDTRVQIQTQGEKGFRNWKNEGVVFGVFISTDMALVLNGFVKSIASSLPVLMLNGAIVIAAF